MSYENEHLVIIGASAAGAKAAAKAKRDYPGLNISMFTKEKYTSYSACGMPYYLKGEIKTLEELLVRTPEEFRKSGINVFTHHEILDINPSKKTIFAKNLQTQKIFEYPYTKLLIATGAKSITPNIEGINYNNIFQIRTLQDTINIKNAMKKAKTAAIVGIGYVGLELAEAFTYQGLNTKIIEKDSHIMNHLDDDMSDLLLDYTEKIPNIQTYINAHIRRFIPDNSGNVKQIELKSGHIIDVDMVVIAIGVEPESKLANSINLELGPTGAIKVNEYMQTSIKDIFAAGDCTEKTHLVTQRPVFIPLGTTANKEGRIVAQNLFENKYPFKGVIGAAITKFYDFKAAIAGLGEEEAAKNNINYKSIVISDIDMSGYMPEAKKITMKLVSAKNSNRILGAQIVGEGNVTQRINAIATAISHGMTLDDYLKTDLPYAPPFSTSIDITLTAAQLLKEKV